MMQLNPGHVSSSSFPNWHSRRGAMVFVWIVVTVFVGTTMQRRRQRQALQKKECSYCIMLHAPVCDVQGIVYLNSCIADCQDIATKKCTFSIQQQQQQQQQQAYNNVNNNNNNGELETNTARQLQPNDDDDDTVVVTGAVMNRYASAGFVFVGHAASPPSTTTPTTTTISRERTSSSSSTTIVVDDVVDYDHMIYADISTTAAATERPKQAIRWTADGYEYRQVLPPSLDDDHDQDDQQDGKTRRSLAVLGRDDRTRANTAVTVEIDYWNRDGGCSGSLIGPHTVLTSAHCVWNYESGNNAGAVRVAPGRQSRQANNNPYGLYQIESITLLDEWKRVGAPIYDMAVVQIAPDDDTCRKAGDVAGYMALSSRNSIRESEAVIYGYPADKPDGEQWRTNDCRQDWDFDNSNFAFHGCDTAPGMSGSPVVVNNAVTGVHGYGFLDLGVNGAVMLDNYYVSLVRGWASENLATTCEPPLNAAPEPSQDDNNNSDIGNSGSCSSALGCAGSNGGGTTTASADPGDESPVLMCGRDVLITDCPK